MKVGIASVLMSKNEIGIITYTHTLHWSINIGEDEMRGRAVKRAMEIKPGFSIDSIVVDVINIKFKPFNFFSRFFKQKVV